MYKLTRAYGDWYRSRTSRTSAISPTTVRKNDAQLVRQNGRDSDIEILSHCAASTVLSHCRWRDNEMAEISHPMPWISNSDSVDGLDKNIFTHFVWTMYYSYLINIHHCLLITHPLKRAFRYPKWRKTYRICNKLIWFDLIICAQFLLTHYPGWRVDTLQNGLARFKKVCSKFWLHGRKSEFFIFFAF